MADLIYNSFKTDLMKNNIDLEVDTFKIMLVTSSYIENKDTHSKRSDITNEISGTGYVEGGKALTGLLLTQDDAADRTEWHADDVTWSASTITAFGAVIYKSRGGATTADELVCFIDFGVNKISTNGDFTVNFNASGILVLA